MFWLLLGAFLVYVVWKMRDDQKTKRRAEATQEPSLHTETDWTPLDQLAMDIARHGALARWYTQGRQLFRETPIPDINRESGWDIFCDDWGSDISKDYERIFWEIRGLPPRERARRLKAAQEQSLPARAACSAKPIILPDDTQKMLPFWMQINPNELSRSRTHKMIPISLGL